MTGKEHEEGVDSSCQLSHVSSWTGSEDHEHDEHLEMFIFQSKETGDVVLMTPSESMKMLLETFSF